MKKNKKKLYGIILTGIKDIEIAIVEKTLYDWIFNKTKNHDAIRKIIKERANTDDVEDLLTNFDYMLTNTGSSTEENDRALFARLIALEEFYSMKSFIKWVAKNGELQAIYEGCIY